MPLSYPKLLPTLINMSGVEEVPKLLEKVKSIKSINIL